MNHWFAVNNFEKDEKSIRLGKFAILHINFVSLTELQIYSLSKPTLFKLTSILIIKYKLQRMVIEVRIEWKNL